MIRTKRITPRRLLIEITDLCNAACDYCLRKYLKRGVFHLPLYVFKDWIRSAPYAEWVQPQGIGEPLMYPDLIEGLAYCKSQKKKTMFYTNASLLSKTMTMMILATGLDTITFSVDGYNEDTFGTRRGLSWRKVYRNIMWFQKMRNRGGYKTHTTVRATITDRNKYRIPNYVNFWKNKVDKVNMMCEVGFPTPDQIDRTPYAQGKGFTCFHIFEPYRELTPVITIPNNGNVVACCQDWFSDYIMGNAYFDDILDIFNNRRFAKLRAGMRSGKRYPYLCEFCRLAKMNKSRKASLSKFAFLGASYGVRGMLAYLRDEVLIRG